MGMKTKGALIWEFNQPWSIEEIEIGDPVKDEVKIQMEASGMCHSDHHLVTGDIPMAGFPVLGGHEGAGIVTEVGPGVENVAARRSRRAVVHPSCGECPSCRPDCATCATSAQACSVACAVSDNTHRITAKGGARLPDDAAGNVQPVHGRAQELRGEDQSVDPVRGGLPGRLRRDDGLRLGGQGRRHPPRRRRTGHRCRRRRHVGRTSAVNAGARNLFVIEPVEWKRDAALKFGATHALSGH